MWRVSALSALALLTGLAGWRCTASFFGTLTQTGASNQRCRRS